MPTKLDDATIGQRLPELAGWALRDDKLHKRFEFVDFAQAFGFMASVAVVAESMNHHPEWSNVYNRVEVELVTHDAGGLTELDFALARRMDELARRSAPAA